MLNSHFNSWKRKVSIDAVQGKLSVLTSNPTGWRSRSRKSKSRKLPTVESFTTRREGLSYSQKCLKHLGFSLKLANILAI